MRWLFLLVLALNIGYILVNLDDTPSVPAGISSGADSVETIVLLKELEQIKVIEQHDSAPADELKTAEGSDQAGTISTAGATDSDEQLSAEPELQSPVLQSKEPAKESEVDVVEAVPHSAPDIPVKPASQAKSCFTYGPFRELEVLLELKHEIKPYVADIEYRSREESERTAYWVHIKPAKNRSAARATAKKLKAKKIKDFYIVRSGKHNNAISLGHFKSGQRASNLKKKLVKLGFDVVIEPIFKTYTLYWLDYQLSDGAVIPESIDKKYAGKSAQENFSRLDRVCD